MAQAARKIVRFGFAGCLILLGLALLILPGPGLLCIALGVGVIGRELRWPWVLRFERKLRNLARRTRARIQSGVSPRS